MLTFSSLSSISQPQVAQSDKRAAVTAQNQKTPQVKPALTKDVFFGGKPPNSQKELQQTTLVVKKSGKLSFTPNNNEAKAALRKRLDDLIASGADLDKPATRFGNPILHDLAYLGDHKLVLKALANGARLNSRDSQLSTPLHWAARAGHKDIVETLLYAGANPNAIDLYGNMPMHGALSLGHKDVVKLLSKYCRLRFFG